MDERIVAKVVDEGSGCFTLQVGSLEEVARLKEVLSSPCGLRVVQEEVPELVVVEETDDVPVSHAILCCPLEPGLRWDDSVCRDLTGLDETAVDLIREAIAFQDQGGS